MRVSDLKTYSVEYTPNPSFDVEAATSTLAGTQNTNNTPFASSPDDSGIDAGLKAVGNTPASAFNLGRNIFDAVTNPIDTAKGVGRAVAGLGSKVQNTLGKGVDAVFGTEGFGQTGDTASVQTFDALVDVFKERYGSLEAAQKTATEDPVGFGADVVGILAGGGTAALNRVSKANVAAKTRISEVASGKLDEAALSQMEKAIDIRPSDITKISRPNIAGVAPAEWLLRRDFQGSTEKIIDDLGEYGRSTKSQVDEGLAAINTTVDAAEAVPATQMIEILQKTFDGTIGNERLLESLSDMKSRESFTLTELNEIKRLADSELQIFKTTGALKDNAASKGMANVRDDLKTLIENKAAENGFEDVRLLNKETQVSREIADAMQKRADARSKLPEIGLRDGIFAAGGFFTGGFAGAAALVISKQILESTQFRTFVANKLKQADPTEIKSLEQALETKNYTAAAQYLIPLINEFENGQENLEDDETNLPN